MECGVRVGGRLVDLGCGHAGCDGASGFGDAVAPFGAVFHAEFGDGVAEFVY